VLHRHTSAEVTPVVATDADLAGHRAAARAFWQLMNRGEPPRHLALPDGADPASYLTDAGPEQLHAALTAAAPLTDVLIERRVDWYADRLDTVEGTLAAVRSASAVIAALPPEQWQRQVDRLTDRTGADRGTVITEVVERATTYGDNPGAYATGQAAIDTDLRLAGRVLYRPPAGPEPTTGLPAAAAETETAEVPYVTAAALAEQLAAAEQSVARITSRRADRDDESTPDRPGWDQPDEPAWQYPYPDPAYDDWDDDRTR
jgi:DNA primase